MPFVARLFLFLMLTLLGVKSHADEVACRAPPLLKQIAINWAWVELEKGSSAVVIRKGKELKVNKTFYLESGDKVRGYGEITLHGAEHAIRFFREFVFEVDIEKKDLQSIFNIHHLQGIAYVLTRKCEHQDCARIKIETPTSTVGIRGTEFFVEILSASKAQDLEVFYLLKGEIDVADQKKLKTSLVAGQMLTIDQQGGFQLATIGVFERKRLQGLLGPSPKNRARRSQ